MHRYYIIVAYHTYPRHSYQDNDARWSCSLQTIQGWAIRTIVYTCKVSYNDDES